MVGITLGAYAASLALLLVAAVVQHGVLVLTGERRHGMGATTETLAYCMAPQIFCMIPCLGTYLLPLTMLWTAICQGVALSARQGVSWWRATLAASVPMVVVVGGLVWLLWIGTVNSMSSWAPTRTLNQRTWDLYVQMEAMAPGNLGAGPSHGVELLLDAGIVIASDYMHPYSMTPTTSVHLMGTDLNDLFLMDDAARTQRMATAPLPSDVIAHRVGDVVFTYHGISIDPSSTPVGSTLVTPPDSDDLWVLIMLPDAATRSTTPNVTFMVVDADGTQASYTMRSLPTVLNTQNLERRRVGLDPLPDPSIVTMSTPATSSAVNSAQGYRP